MIEIKQRELQEARAAIQANEADLASARRYKSGKLGNVKEHRHELEGDLRALQAASAQVTNQLQGAGPLPAGPIRQGGGGYIWPVNGPVVSPFGMRWGRLHAGVDIAVPAGTPIRAAASGTVAMAGWMGGYGQYTCIQHGGGVATCYAHQSSIGVGAGQQREAGAGDRFRRLHRPLLRRPPALRGAGQRVSRGPDGLPLAALRRSRRAGSG